MKKVSLIQKDASLKPHHFHNRIRATIIIIKNFVFRGYNLLIKFRTYINKTNISHASKAIKRQTISFYSKHWMDYEAILFQLFNQCFKVAAWSTKRLTVTGFPVAFKIPFTEKKKPQIKENYSKIKTNAWINKLELDLHTCRLVWEPSSQHVNRS